MRVARFLNGLIFGAVVGAAAALLTAPCSGEDLKARFLERLNAVMEEGRRAAAERRAEMEAQFAEAKRPPRRA